MVVEEWLGLEALRSGRITADEYYQNVDMPFYHEVLDEFLPKRIIDVHSHITCPEELIPQVPEPTFWPDKVCPNGMTLPRLIECHGLMFPGKRIRPIVFPMPSVRFDPEIGNAYASRESKKFGAIPLILVDPRWSADELERRVEEGGFFGLKPYPVMAKDKTPEQIEIYDYLPREHLQLANEKGWFIILHIPRPERLADPLNLSQLAQIDEDYPKANVVVAHVGRSYCPRFGLGLDHLKETQNILFDISANTNQVVFERLIDTIESDRILYGSDLPIFAMHARRICEGDNYVNIVLGADWEDEHTRIGSLDDGITFFLYEEIAAFKRAAEEMDMVKSDIEKVFFHNAARILPLD